MEDVAATPSQPGQRRRSSFGGTPGAWGAHVTFGTVSRPGAPAWTGISGPSTRRACCGVPPHALYSRIVRPRVPRPFPRHCAHRWVGFPSRQQLFDSPPPALHPAQALAAARLR